MTKREFIHTIFSRPISKCLFTNKLCSFYDSESELCHRSDFKSFKISEIKFCYKFNIGVKK